MALYPFKQTQELYLLQQHCSTLPPGIPKRAIVPIAVILRDGMK